MNVQTLLLVLVAANAISLAVFVGRRLFVRRGHYPSGISKGLHSGYLCL
jgi:hypothetical protein